MLPLPSVRVVASDGDDGGRGEGGPRAGAGDDGVGEVLPDDAVGGRSVLLAVTGRASLPFCKRVGREKHVSGEMREKR